MFKCYKLGSQQKAFAVKITREDDEEKIIAIKNEFEITRMLNHPNIA